jgi:hypothetical protein
MYSLEIILLAGMIVYVHIHAYSFYMIAWRRDERSPVPLREEDWYSYAYKDIYYLSWVYMSKPEDEMYIESLDVELTSN